MRHAAPGAAGGGVSEMASDRDLRAPTVSATTGERAALLRCARSGTLAARIVLRSRIVLLATEGLPRSDIARRLGTTPKTIALWVRRFEAGGLEALAKDASGRGRKRSIGPAAIEAVRAGLKNGLTVREVARQTGISPASVVRLSDTAGR